MRRKLDLWMQHLRREGWLERRGEADVIDARVLELFGPPPYRFLRVGDPAPEHLLTRKRRTILPDDYLREHPVPNYAALGRNPQFVDRQGRQYWRGGGDLERNLLERGEIGGQPIVLSEESTRTASEPIRSGDQLMWLRLPIALVRSVRIQPPSVGDTLHLIHQASSIPASATVIKSFFRSGRRTGWVILGQFTAFP